MSTLRLLMIATAASGAIAYGDDAPPREPTDQEIRTALVQLGDDDWRVRESATETLRAAGDRAVVPMARVARTAKDVEVLVRLRRVACERFWITRSAFLGIQMNGMSEGGVMVGTVLAGTAAERAGLRPGDVLAEFDGQALGNIEIGELAKRIRACPPGRTVKVVVMRLDKRTDLKVTLGVVAADQLALRVESVNPDEVGQFEEWWNAKLREP